MNAPVWITGTGCICACGNGLPEIMANLYAGKHFQTPPDFLRLPENVPGALFSSPVCAVRDEWMGESAWRSCSTADSSRLLLMAAEEALASSDLHQLGAKTGFCVGTTAGCALHFLGDYAATRGQAVSQTDTPDVCPENTPRKYSEMEYFYRHTMAPDLATFARKWRSQGFSGPVLTVSNACTSGADAIATAAEWIRQGLCNLALAGGTDAISLIPYVGFNKLMIYSPEPCKPFDKGRKGLNLGEGAAVLVLESAKHARARGAKAKGTLLGWGMSSDAHHMTAPHPHGRGLRMAVEKSLLMAGIAPKDLGFINAHGTATPDNDRTEAAVYTSMPGSTPLWASKGATGHCLGGAGAIEAALCLEALLAGLVPPSIGCSEPEDAVAGMLSRRAEPYGQPYALSASLGFGGSNTALVFAAPSV